LSGERRSTREIKNASIGLPEAARDGLGIVYHLVVPEPQHAVALGFEEPGPACVRLGRGIMLPTIDLDDQSRLMADKVKSRGPVGPKLCTESAGSG